MFGIWVFLLIFIVMSPARFENGGISEATIGRQDIKQKSVMVGQEIIRKAKRPTVELRGRR
jgi:hypothetical protein